MSKAFTKEDQESDMEGPEISSHSPITVKNYMTPSGAKKLQDEFRKLKYEERPKVCEVVAWAAGNGDRSENADYTYGKKRLREIDKRLGFLAKRLENIEVVDPTTIKSDQVLFGATVTIREEDDNEKIYSIVGIDESDVSMGRISWISPLASALMKARVGDVVSFRSPNGMREVEVIEIKYG